MNPVSHFLLGWVVAGADGRLSRRERGAVTLAGVVPDVDGLGIIAEKTGLLDLLKELKEVKD